MAKRKYVSHFSELLTLFDETIIKKSNAKPIENHARMRPVPERAYFLEKIPVKVKKKYKNSPLPAHCPVKMNHRRPCERAMALADIGECNCT